MHRRDLIAGVAALTVVRGADAAEDGQAFDAQTVKAQARALAAAPYKAPDTKLPDAHRRHLEYDRLSGRSDSMPNQALWRGDRVAVPGAILPSRLAVLANRVDMFEVVEGSGAAGRRIGRRCSPFGPIRRGRSIRDLGFAGMRLHSADQPARLLRRSRGVPGRQLLPGGWAATWGMGCRQPGVVAQHGGPGGRGVPGCSGRSGWSGHSRGRG